MKVELDKKAKSLDYIPENHYDAYRLGLVVATIGWGSLHLNSTTKEIIKVTFGVDSLIDYLGKEK